MAPGALRLPPLGSQRTQQQIEAPSSGFGGSNVDSEPEERSPQRPTARDVHAPEVEAVRADPADEDEESETEASNATCGCFLFSLRRSRKINPAVATPGVAPTGPGASPASVSSASATPVHDAAVPASAAASPAGPEHDAVPVPPVLDAAAASSAASASSPVPAASQAQSAAPATLPATAAAQVSTELHIGTWNSEQLQLHNGLSNRAQMDKLKTMAGQIIDSGVEVVALQEVCRSEYGERALEELVRLLDSKEKGRRRRHRDPEGPWRWEALSNLEGSMKDNMMLAFLFRRIGPGGRVIISASGPSQRMLSAEEQAEHIGDALCTVQRCPAYAQLYIQEPSSHSGAAVLTWSVILTNVHMKAKVKMQGREGNRRDLANLGKVVKAIRVPNEALYETVGHVPVVLLGDFNEDSAFAPGFRRLRAKGWVNALPASTPSACKGRQLDNIWLQTGLPPSGTGEASSSAAPTSMPTSCALDRDVVALEGAAVCEPDQGASDHRLVHAKIRLLRPLLISKPLIQPGRPGTGFAVMPAFNPPSLTVAFDSPGWRPPALAPPTPDIVEPELPAPPAPVEPPAPPAPPITPSPPSPPAPQPTPAPSLGRVLLNLFRKRPLHRVAPAGNA